MTVSASAIPGRLLLAVLAMQLLVMAPHLLRVPPWVGLLWGLCAGWRLLIQWQGLGPPGPWARAGLVLVAGGGVAVGYGLDFSLEPAVAMLLLAFALKLLEMRSARDLRVVLLLAYFVLAAQFLYDQRMAMAAWQLLAFVVITALVISQQQRPGPLQLGASLKWAAVLTAQALPLAVVMFVFFPRLAPLWAVPMPDSGARTGLSESMTPGDVARLTRSEALAFRVEFDGERPALPSLYWRVLTYDHYRKGSWSQAPLPADLQRPVYWLDDSRPPAWQQQMPAGETWARYTVLAEPSWQPWLIALDSAQPEAGAIGLGRDFRLLYEAPVTQRIRYRAAAVRAQRDVELPQWLRSRNLQLPPLGNPQTRAWAEGLQQRMGDDGRALADAVLQRFSEAPFRYTLTPPTMQGSAVDQFLFEAQAGFCAHYAGAFVFVMRAAGVPARVVAGYHGGEPNPVGDHWRVRQADAHAWAEIWLPGAGWQRVDPTAAIAPERVEQGADGLAASDSGGTGTGRSTEAAWWQQGAWLEVYFMLDTLEHRWNLFVLNYDGERQLQLLTRLLGQVTVPRVAAAVTLAALAALLLALLAGAGPVSPRAGRPEYRLLQSIDRQFRHWGLPRQAGEAPTTHLRRVAGQFPHQYNELLQLADLLEVILYDPAAGGRGPARAKRRWRRLRWACRASHLRTIMVRRS